MTRLDRYIFNELFLPFCFGLVAFSTIIAGSSVIIPLSSESAKLGIPFWDVVHIIIYQMPKIVAYSIPMALLLASIIGFNRLSGDMEIIAFRSAGISFFRLLVPVVVIGLIMSLFTILLHEFIVPVTIYSADKTLRSFQFKSPSTIKRNINFTEYAPSGAPSRIINVLEVEEHLLKHITLAEFDQGILSRIVRANSGFWNQDNNTWEFYNGMMHFFSENTPNQYTVIEFDKQIISMAMDLTQTHHKTVNVDEMSARELHQRILSQKKMGIDFREDLVRFHLKFSIPFACLIFSVLGSCIGLKPHRKSSSFGFGMSLAIIISYYIFIGVSISLSYIFPALFVAWLPNFIILFLTLYLVTQVTRQ